MPTTSATDDSERQATAVEVAARAARPWREGRADGVVRPDGMSTWQRDVGAPLATGAHPGAAWSRRATLGVLALVVLAALAGLLGVHTSTASATTSGWHLTLRYPRVARAGLDVAWQATVSHRGGLGKEVTLAISGDYFNIYETQGFHPQPADETRDGTTLYLTFTAPPGNTFVVDFDTYVQPASQSGSAATLAVVDPQTFVPLTSVHFSTLLTP